MTVSLKDRALLVKFFYKNNDCAPVAQQSRHSRDLIEVGGDFVDKIFVLQDLTSHEDNHFGVIDKVLAYGTEDTQMESFLLDW
ncbi:hypothetical protein TNCV_1581581 [Trichonephila clavipes]|nr:hypothetical protein TNCV_1581581 [Trichonephila clavipes]